MMHFTKWHGCGNDFVFVNGFKENAEQAAAMSPVLCDSITA